MIPCNVVVLGVGMSGLGGEIEKGRLRAKRMEIVEVEEGDR